jgi:flagellar motor switch protein FliG
MLSGPEKVIVFLALAGEENASALVEKLEEKELVQLRRGTQSIKTIEQEQIDEVFVDVTKMLGRSNILPHGMAEYLQRILTKALGPEKAAPILQRISDEDAGSMGIEGLHEMDAKILATFLHEEHPQTIAFILAHLYPGHAGEVLSLLAEEKQAEVAHRITRLGRTPPGIIEEVSDVLHKEIRQVRGKEMGGVRPLAEILNCVDKATEERVLTKLGEMDGEIVENVRKLMFIFEDLSKIADKSMQVLVREVPKEKWVLAVRTASSALKEKIYKNMSERAAALMKEEMETSGPVRLRDVEGAQREIVDQARRLEAEGQIVLSQGRGKEDVLV